MKNSWIKCSDRMPDLEYIGESWNMSRSVLVCNKEGTVSIDCWNDNRTYNKHPNWLNSIYNNIVYWQPIELPEEYE